MKERRVMAKKDTVLCKVCEQEFSVYLSVLKRGKGKFCSVKCYQKYWIKNYAALLGRKGFEMRIYNKKNAPTKQKHFWV